MRTVPVRKSVVSLLWQAKVTCLWKSLKRYSLEESFQIADASVLVPWEENLENRILIERFLNRLRAGEHYVDSLKTFGITELDEKQFDMLMEMAEKELPFEEKIRVLYSISRSMKFMKKNFHGISYDQVEQKCFATIQQEIFKASNVNQVKKYKIAENQVKVNLPVRVNWGGGWTDTPPYCNEKGGVVLNAAILLNGQEPIEVELRKLPENHIEFASLDLDAHGVVTTAAEIQDCHNPYDSFALHKAALIACGIIPMEGEADLEKILDEMGGGFYMSTRVKGVPKGSGLGTSSILSGACVRALGKFLGTTWSDCHGILPMIIAAQRNGIKKVIIPVENLKEAKLVQGVTIIGLQNLSEVVRFLEGKNVDVNRMSDKMEQEDWEKVVDFADVKGQKELIEEKEEGK